MSSTDSRRLALVVDDSATARKILSHFLLELGFSVVSAEDAEQALKILEERTTDLDLALVDWNMPGMDGIALVKEARRRSLLTCPTMMVTTESSLSHIERALEAGVQEFLMKPFEPEMLKDKLVLLGFELPG